MRRRDFLKSTVAVAAAAELGMVKAKARVPGFVLGLVHETAHLEKDNTAKTGFRYGTCASHSQATIPLGLLP